VVEQVDEVLFSKGQKRVNEENPDTNAIQYISIYFDV